jgi:hypothetical protein
MEFSRPEGLLDWLLGGCVFLFVWLGIPILLALSLFVSIHRISFDKLALTVESGASQNCLEYFTGAKAANRVESQPSLPAK